MFVQLLFVSLYLPRSIRSTLRDSRNMIRFVWINKKKTMFEVERNICLRYAPRTSISMLPSEFFYMYCSPCRVNFIARFTFSIFFSPTVMGLTFRCLVVDGRWPILVKQKSTVFSSNSELWHFRWHFQFFDSLVENSEYFVFFSRCYISMETLMESKRSGRRFSFDSTDAFWKCIQLFYRNIFDMYCGMRRIVTPFYQIFFSSYIKTITKIYVCEQVIQFQCFQMT